MVSTIAKSLQDMIIWIAWLPWVMFISKAAIVWMFACIPSALFTMIVVKRENCFGCGGIVLVSVMVLRIIGLLAILIYLLLGLLI